jgi:hypothetical protein
MTLALMDDEDEDLAPTYGALGAALRRPEADAGLPDLMAAARLRHIQVRMRGLAPLARDPGLAGRIRGALGAALLDSASAESKAGLPCPWTPSCAFDALFRKQGRMTPGIDFPSPWLIALDPAKGDLTITLTLFGMACEWAPAAAEAFTDALLHRVDWAGQSGLFVQKREIMSRRLRAEDGIVDPAEPTRSATLAFLSPLVISNVDALHDPVPAFTGLGHRLEGIARWHGLTLSRVNWAERAADIRACGFEWDEVHAVSWPRGSKRQDKTIGMEGVIGSLSIEGMAEISADTLRILGLGAAFRVGADVSFGCGRYVFSGREHGLK